MSHWLVAIKLPGFGFSSLYTLVKTIILYLPQRHVLLRSILVCMMDLQTWLDRQTDNSVVEQDIILPGGDNSYHRAALWASRELLLTKVSSGRKHV